MVNIDTDGDGIRDNLEDLNGDGNLANDDTDGDNTPNYLDNDDDNDLVLTLDEDVNNDGDWFNDDTDGDGIPNFLDSNDFEHLNGEWKLIEMDNKYDLTHHGSHTRKYESWKLKNDTTEYWCLGADEANGVTNPVLKKTILKSKLTINYPNYTIRAEVFDLNMNPVRDTVFSSAIVYNEPLSLVSVNDYGNNLYKINLPIRNYFYDRSDSYLPVGFSTLMHNDTLKFQITHPYSLESVFTKYVFVRD